MVDKRLSDALVGLAAADVIIKRLKTERDALLAACEAALEELDEPAEWKDVGPATHRRMIAAIAKVKQDD